MQIIQGIREKGAAVVIGVIALSLIGFILMDANSGGSKLFGSSSPTTSIARVNGEDIDVMEFNKRVAEAEEQERQMQQQQQQFQQPKTPYQIKDQVWNTLVALKVFYAEAGKLGIGFTAKELESILKSEDPSNPLMQDQTMKDSITGQLSQAQVLKVISEIKKSKDDRREFFNSRIINPLKQTSIVAKYTGLLNAGAYYPTWMQERDNADSKNFANISYVAIPYTVIPDSTVTVSDAEVETYVSKHKKLFKQEDGRIISYVTFSQLPKADDSARVRDELATLKQKFTEVSDSNMQMFLVQNSSRKPYENTYVPKSKIATANADTIVKQAVGSVFGPYVDGNNYTLARIVGTKSLPDSVKARHILFPSKDAQGQPTDEAASKKMADSILALIKGGASFDALARQYGTDATKDKGGDLGTFGYGAMVGEFNDFCFNKPAGTKDVVKTQFGYHVVEIVSQKGTSTAYKVAFMSKEIDAGQSTMVAAEQSAIKLSGQGNGKNFEAYITKNGLQKVSVPVPVKEIDDAVGNLQNARQVVRWAFNASAGDVSEPFLIGDEHVVALVERVLREGTQDVKTARPAAEIVIRKKKIAETIIKKLGATPTLETAAAAYSKQVQVAGADSSLVFSGNIINGIGQEPKVIGASFNKEYQAKPSQAIEGNTGVYVIKVNSIGSKPADTPEEAAKKAKDQVATLRNQVSVGWYEGLKNQATIKDNRSKTGY